MTAWTHDGRVLRLLTLIDEYTPECLAILVARRIGVQEVAGMDGERLREIDRVYAGRRHTH